MPLEDQSTAELHTRNTLMRVEYCTQFGHSESVSHKYGTLQNYHLFHICHHTIVIILLLLQVYNIA